jgi:hypothetical protein
MTDENLKLHRAQLLVKIEDAGDDLMAVRDKALSAVKAHEEALGKVRHNVLLEPSPADFTLEGDVENRLTPDELVSLRKADVVFIHLIEEMKKARQEVFTLAKLKSVRA